MARLFTVPASVDGIAPLIGETLMQSETGDRDVDNAALYRFYNRPALGSAYAPIRLLPLDLTWRRSLADRPWPAKSLPEVMGRGSATLRAFIHEHLFVSLFRACAESLASENASRLAAMERADRNIDELLGNLNSEFHRLRQSGIDEELFDVIGGYEALTKGRAPRPRAVAYGGGHKTT